MISTSTTSCSWAPAEPVKATQVMPILRACSKAVSMFGLLPEVVMPIKTSPGLPNASTCREKIRLKPKSFAAAVIVDVSVVNAIAAMAGRLISKRIVSSVARCWASAALPPLPAKRILLP